LDVVVMALFALPIAPRHSQWFRNQIRADSVLGDEIGWRELVATIGTVRDGLPAADRARLGILAGNYGEAGAIDLYGPRYGLPRAISGVNSYWERGYGNPPPETLIVVGLTRQYLAKHFSSCKVVAHNGNRYGIENEESLYHKNIYVCSGLREPWPAFWKNFRSFG
jgi:hypothetical protein